MLLTSLSLLMGRSWEESFDAAVDSVTEDSKPPGTVKIGITLSRTCVILPVYVRYLKPVAMKYEVEREEADESYDNAQAA